MTTRLDTKRIANAHFLPAALLFFFACSPSFSQGVATATQRLALSAFGAGTGTWTNLEGGRNLGITAGGDFAFLSYHRFRPVAEIRGNHAVYNGTISSQRSVLAGLKVERAVGPFHPYVDFLAGRGGINYGNGYLYQDLLYLKSTSAVYSGGLGVDYDISQHWAAKVDFQYQRWDAPVLPGGVLHPTALSAGVIYRFDFNRRHTWLK